MFEHFPTAAADVSKFMLENLAVVSVEMLRSELISSIIPKLVDEANQKGVSHEAPEYALLCQYTDKPPSYQTVRRWLDYLGFKRGKMQKTYYVDGHEHDEQKDHRKLLTTKYLTVMEPRSHRWVQMTSDKYHQLKQDAPDTDPLTATGYKFTDPQTGANMVELHVDDHASVQTLANMLHGAFGGTTSIRIPVGTRAILIFGQDEAVYSQHSFNSIQ